MEGLGPIDILIWTGFLGTVVFVPLVIGLCVLWAPFASWICANSARKNDLDVRRYAVAGGVYSILLALPWVYLLTRMSGDRPSRLLVKWAYVLLYAAWLWLSIMGGMTYVTSGEGILANFVGLAQALRWINLATWIGSLVWLLYVNDRETARARDWWDTDKTDNPIMPRPAYIAPFILAVSWAVLTCAAVYVGLST